MNCASRQPVLCSPSTSCTYLPAPLVSGRRLLWRHGAVPRLHGQALQARRSRFDNEDIGGPSRFSWEDRRDDDSFRFSYGERQVQVPKQTLWVSALALLGAGVLIGPIVAGLAVMAMSLGVAMSVGAFALSAMFIPMIIFTLMFGGFFGSFALLGVGLILPQIIGLVVTGGALALGFSLVRGALRGPSATSKVTASSTSKTSPPLPTIDLEEEEARREARRVAQELRDFDAMLKERERRSRVADKEWRG